MKHWKLEGIRLEVETKKHLALKKANECKESGGGMGTAYARQMHRIDAFDEVLEIIDGQLNLSVNIENLMSRDVGRWVIFTGGNDVAKRGRLISWQTSFNHVFVVFDNPDYSDWQNHKQECCLPEFLRFETADLILQVKK